MAKDYVIFVEFRELVTGRDPVTQTLNVNSNGTDLAVLIEALNDSTAVESIAIYANKITALNRLTREDIGYNNDRLSKLK